MHLVVSNDVEGVHGLYSCRKVAMRACPLRIESRMFNSAFAEVRFGENEPARYT